MLRRTLLRSLVMIGGISTVMACFELTRETSIQNDLGLESVAAVTPVLFSGEPVKKYFLIGNSLTWDTRPTLLDGDVQFHVDCGKPLHYIFDHPEKPCVDASSLWPTAFSTKKYDFVTVQPHYGATIEQDEDTISQWIGMQPQAVFVIHTGWARHAERAAEYATVGITETLVHNPDYFTTLIERLSEKFPNVSFRQTHAIDALDKISSDIKQNQAPYSDVTDLYRDKIHMDVVDGRYLMHNVMRIALGQSVSTTGFEKITPEHQAYLDKVLSWVRQLDATDAQHVGAN